MRDHDWDRWRDPCSREDELVLRFIVIQPFLAVAGFYLGFLMAHGVFG